MYRKCRFFKYDFKKIIKVRRIVRFQKGIPTDNYDLETFKHYVIVFNAILMIFTLRKHSGKGYKISNFSWKNKRKNEDIQVCLSSFKGRVSTRSFFDTSRIGIKILIYCKTMSLVPKT